MTEEQTKLIAGHYRLVPKIVRKFVCKNIAMDPLFDFEELISEGNVALIQAATKFDATKKTSFRTFINLVIPYHIQDYLRTHDVLSREERKKYKKVDTPVITAQRCGDFPLIQGLLITRDSITNEVMFEQYHNSTLENNAQFKQAIELVKKIGRRRLNERNFKIMLAVYLRGDLLLEIAKSLGLNESRVSQINSKNMETMRKEMRIRGYTQTRQLI